jgi:hypothetical protein
MTISFSREKLRVSRALFVFEAKPPAIYDGAFFAD